MLKPIDELYNTTEKHVVKQHLMTDLLTRGFENHNKTKKILYWLRDGVYNIIESTSLKILLGLTNKY